MKIVILILIKFLVFASAFAYDVKDLKNPTVKMLYEQGDYIMAKKLARRFNLREVQVLEDLIQKDLVKQYQANKGSMTILEEYSGFFHEDDTFVVEVKANNKLKYQIVVKDLSSPQYKLNLAREVAAYRVSHALGLDVVPPTTSVNGKLVQFYIPDALKSEVQHQKILTQAELKAKARSKAYGHLYYKRSKARTFRYLIDDADAHSSNFVKGRSGIFSIDHEFSFGGDGRLNRNNKSKIARLPKKGLELQDFEMTFESEAQWNHFKKKGMPELQKVIDDPQFKDVDFSGVKKRYLEVRKGFDDVISNNKRLSKQVILDKVFKMNNTRSNYRFNKRPYFKPAGHIALPKTKRFSIINSYDLTTGKTTARMTARMTARTTASMKLARIATTKLFKFTGPVDVIFYAVDLGMYVKDMSVLSRRDDLSGYQKRLRYFHTTYSWLSPVYGIGYWMYQTFKDKDEYIFYKKLDDIRLDAIQTLRNNNYDYSFLDDKIEGILTELRDAGFKKKHLFHNDDEKAQELAQRALVHFSRFQLLDLATVEVDSSFLNLNYGLWKNSEELKTRLEMLNQAYQVDIVNTMSENLSDASKTVLFCAITTGLATDEGIEDEPKDYRSRCLRDFSVAEVKTALSEVLTTSKQQSLVSTYNEHQTKRKALLDDVYGSNHSTDLADFYANTPTDDPLKDVDVSTIVNDSNKAARKLGFHFFQQKLWDPLLFSGHRKDWDDFFIWVRNPDTRRKRKYTIYKMKPHQYSLAKDTHHGYATNWPTFKDEVRDFVKDSYFPYLTGEKISLHDVSDDFPDWTIQEIATKRVAVHIDTKCKKDKNKNGSSSCEPVYKWFDFPYLKGDKTELIPDDFQGLWISEFLKKILLSPNDYQEYSGKSSPYFEDHLKPNIDSDCTNALDQCFNNFAKAAFEMENVPAKYQDDFFYTTLRNHHVFATYGSLLAQRSYFDLPKLQIRTVSEKLCANDLFQPVSCEQKSTYFPYKVLGNKIKIYYPNRVGCVTVESGDFKQADCEENEGWTNSNTSATYEGVAVSTPVTLILQGQPLQSVPTFASLADARHKLGESTDFISKLLREVVYYAGTSKATVKRLNKHDKVFKSSTLAFAGGKCVNADISDLSVSLGTCSSTKSSKWWSFPDGKIAIVHLEENKPEYCLSNENNALSLKACQ